MSYTVTLLKRREVADGTMEFTFEKPEGYSFQPGQATDWTLIDPKERDDAGIARSFSIAVSPEDNVLRFATRMRDTAFKRELRQMPIGGRILVDDPWGEFTLTDSFERAVLLAGGIGITPFLSMIEHSARTMSQKPITLFYSNRQPKDAAYLEELSDCAERNPCITVVNTMTDLTQSDAWSGERGFIDRGMLARHLPDVENSTYYIAGPPAMIAAMQKMLLGAGVAQEKIVVDEFLGY